MTLKDEINLDPNNLGYAELMQSGSLQGVADLLNQPNQGTVTVTTLPKSDFFLAIMPAIALLSQSSNLRTKWDYFLQLACASDSIAISSPQISFALDSAVTDGLLTTAQRQAIGVRQGSRAEVILGPGTRVSWQDVLATTK